MSYGQDQGWDVPGTGGAGVGGGPAPGYGGGYGPGGGPPQGRGRHLVVIALVVALVPLLAAAALVLVLRDDGDDPEGATEGPHAFLELAGADLDLVMALRDERNQVMIARLGATDLVSLPETDPVELRRRTDEALADLLSLVPREDGSVHAAYRTVVDEFDGLAGIRSGIDSYDGPVGVDAAASLDPVLEQYGRLRAAVLDVDLFEVVTVDDPDDRDALDLHQQAVRLSVGEDDLAEAVLLDAFSSSTPTVRRLAEAFATAQTDREAIAADAAGTPYEGAVAQALDDTAAVMEAAEPVLAGQGNASTVVGAIEVSTDTGWMGLWRRIERDLGGG